LLHEVHLEGADLSNAHLERAVLRHAHLERAVLSRVHLEGADLHAAYLEGDHLYLAHLEGADLSGARLEGASFSEAHLEGADFGETHLEGVDLSGARLEGANLARAYLEGADLRGAFFDDATRLMEATLFDKKKTVAITVADLHWRGANLAVVGLPPAHLLGDERTARNANRGYGRRKFRDERIANFQAAVRANRQLAVALENQGLNEDAGRFAYNAQLLQQQVFWRQRKFGAYLFSRLLDALAGYGYKPVRGLIAYALVIAAFAFSYSLATQGVLTFGLPPSQFQPLQWYEALVLSISSFHGRGFFQPVQSLGDPVAILAAAEAITGLLIEISFIATFTQRFFGGK
jgi:uncharacterized protein YjbI with pentapeptide repeats